MMRFKKSTAVRIITMTIFVLVMVWLNAATVVAAEKVRQVRVSSQMPVGHFMTIATDRFIKEAEERSNGTLKFTHYPAGQLYKSYDLIDVLPAGGVEMAQVSLNRFIGREPTGHFQGPILGVEADHFMRWWFDEKNGGGIYYTQIQPSFEAKGIHHVAIQNYSPDHCIITKKPVKTLADYKGLKIRAAGRNFGAVVESFGAKAVVMSSADVYMGIQRGTIDGAMSGLSSFVARKWYEIADHVQILNLGNCAMGLAANQKFWESLTPEQREAINEAGRNMELWCFEQSILDHERSLDIMKKAGLEITVLPKDQIDKLTFDAYVEVMGKDVGPEIWKEAVDKIEKTRNVPGTWQEWIKKRKM